MRHLLLILMVSIRKIAMTFGRQMRLAPPQITRTFDDAHQCMLSDPKAPEFMWCPYPVSNKTQLSCLREAFSAECQLAELVQEASPLFQPPGLVVPLPDYFVSVEIYNKLLAWNMGHVQQFLPNVNTLPSILFLE